MNSTQIVSLVKIFAKLPGLGPRSAQRIVLHLLKKRHELLRPLIDSLQNADEALKSCTHCYNLDTNDPCYICNDPKRHDLQTICVVEDVSDLWAMERAQVFKGVYHVLGGTLSAMNGHGPDHLNIAPLIERAKHCHEIILALNATIDGQTTTHYLMDLLKPYCQTITTLAYGMPIGGELDYLDSGTLNAALKSRTMM